MQTTPHTTNHSSPLSLRLAARLGLSVIAALGALNSPVQAERSYFAWGAAYDPALNYSQNGVAVALDRRGNVASTGYTYSNGYEIFYTAKYDALTGAKLWERTFDSGNGGAGNRPASVACDSLGNVIVTGRSEGSGTQQDYYTIKYNAATGATMWAIRYNNANNNSNGEDSPVKVVVDYNDDVIVTGSSVDNGKHEDFYTVKYSGLNGGQLWAVRYNSPGNYIDKPTDLFVDATGNVAVTGFSRVGSDNCYYTAKYNGANGSVIWSKTYDGLGGKDDTGEGVTIDGSGNVLVTGTEITSNGDYVFHTIKYSSAIGQPLWQRTYTSPTDNFHGTAGIVVDGDGNAFVAGTSTLDNFKTTFYTVKYAAATGNTVWEARTDAPGGADFAAKIKIDGNGNPVIAGTSENENFDYDFYAIKYDGSSPGPVGKVLWEQRLNGENDSGNDTLFGLDVDAVGNVAVNGTGKKASPSPYFEMLTAKFNRFLLAPGDPITGPGLTDLAVVSAFNVPALGDTAALGAKVTVKDGKKTYSAILAQGNGLGNHALALQGQPAPDVTGFFKSFNDPVIAPNGQQAFIAKLSGAPGAEATGVWTDAFTGSLQCALQYNKQVPGMASGVVLKSVTSISLRNGYLAALITVKGGDTNSKNATVLLGMSGKNTGYILIRSDAPVNVDGAMSNIKKLSVYTPAKTSPGQGRYHGDNRLVATATLVDKRTVFLTAFPTGGFLPLAATKGAADNLVMGAKWKAFGPPATATNGFNFATLATLAADKLDGISTKNDTAIVYSFLGGAFDNIAIEGETAPDSNGGTYLSFNDPISNDQGRYAFLAKAKGGDFGAGKVGLWYGLSNAPHLAARVGDLAPDAIGNDGASTFSTIKNIALPGGSKSGPIFLATVKGGGANGKNNAGLWGMDSDGFVRQLLRNGDTLGDQTVKKFVLLNSLPGCFSANRSFNGAGGVAALVSFTDKTNAVVYVGVP